MPPYECHVFVCENTRDPSDPRGCCASKQATEIRVRLRDLTKEAGLKGRVRINTAGCLDQCAHGAVVVVYPEGIWYGAVTVADAEEIFRSHVLGGRPVERLRLAHMRRPD